MIDAFTKARRHLEREIASEQHTLIFPLVSDAWIVSSVLQKAIRRSETHLAQRAMSTLLALRGSAVWRRLLVIAFEDIGVGSAELVVQVVAAATNSAWRKGAGGDEAVSRYLVRCLAEASKDRSADYLICSANDHPAADAARNTCARRSVAENLCSVADRNLPLVDRAMAAWLAGGSESREKVDFASLLKAYRALGAPEELVVATGIAAARTREPITLMVPLVWCAANGEQPLRSCENPVPSTGIIDGIPLYALDKHTRIGREAIRRFAQENAAVRACLKTYVPAKQRNDAAYMAAFYTDASPVARRLGWSQSVSLEVLGTEADLMGAGVPAEGLAPLLQAFREGLVHLNEVRAETFARARAAGGR